MRVTNNSTKFKGNVLVKNLANIEPEVLNPIIRSAKDYADNFDVDYYIQIDKPIKDSVKFCTGEVFNLLSINNAGGFPAKKAVTGSLLPMPEANYALSISSDYKLNDSDSFVREFSIIVGNSDADNKHVYTQERMQEILTRWISKFQKPYK